MGSLFSCTCINNLFDHNKEDILLLDSTDNFGLMGPNKTRIGVEGMYINLHTIKIYPEGLFEVSFYCNLSGRPYLIYRCVKLSGFIEYPGWKNEFSLLLSGEYKARLYIEVDRKYLYIGKISVIKDKTVYDLSALCFHKSSVDQEIMGPPRVQNVDIPLVESVVVSCPVNNAVCTIEEKIQDCDKLVPVYSNSECGEKVLENKSEENVPVDIEEIDEENSLEISKSIDKVTFIEDRFSL